MARVGRFSSIIASLRRLDTSLEPADTIINLNLKNISQVERSGRVASDAVYSTLSDVRAAGGVPLLKEGRKVTIYAVGKEPMQSGSAQTLQGGAPAWRINLETEQKWANPLIGWTSTADTDETVSRQLCFFTKDQAIAFAEKNGLEYEIEEPARISKRRPKKYQGYGANFDVKRLPGGKPIGGLRSELK